MTTSGTANAQRSWELAARAGYAVSGVLHILIGVLALRVAFGNGGEQADQSGALSTIASTPFGALVLWFSVVAFLALGAWQVAKAIHGSFGSNDTGERAKAVGRAAVYIALAFAALSFARGGGSDASTQTADATAKLMAAPGRAAARRCGRSRDHRRRHLPRLQGVEEEVPARTSSGCRRGRPGPVVRRLGVLGYVAKGVALGIVGVLFVTAAVTADPSKSTGLDGALHTLRDQPAGVLLLVIVALGFVAYGVYSFVRARYGRI